MIVRESVEYIGYLQMLVLVQVARNRKTERPVSVAVLSLRWIWRDCRALGQYRRLGSMQRALKLGADTGA